MSSTARPPSRLDLFTEKWANFVSFMDDSGLLTEQLRRDLNTIGSGEGAYPFVANVCEDISEETMAKVRQPDFHMDPEKVAMYDKGLAEVVSKASEEQRDKIRRYACFFWDLTRQD